MNRALPQRLLLLVVLASLSACGFKLRGSDYRLPDAWQAVSIETRGNLKPGSDITRELAIQLRLTQGADVHRGVVPGLPRIVLLGERFRTSVGALDSLGRAQEHLLEYVVHYKLVDQAGKELLSAQRIYLRQEQVFSSGTILAKEREQQYLLGQLRTRMANRIIERLLAVVNKG